MQRWRGHPNCQFAHLSTSGNRITNGYEFPILSWFHSLVDNDVASIAINHIEDALSFLNFEKTIHSKRLGKPIVILETLFIDECAMNYVEKSKWPDSLSFYNFRRQMQYEIQHTKIVKRLAILIFYKIIEFPFAPFSLCSNHLLHSTH